MTRKGWLVILGAAGITAATAGCQDKELRTYLGPNGRMEAWQTRAGTAICQLEELSGQPLDTARRICPTGSGGPTDKSSPPSYPPAQ
jgi:hypothetical protein